MNKNKKLLLIIFLAMIFNFLRVLLIIKMVSYHKINSIKKEWIKETLAIKTIHTITEMNEDISAFEFGILVVCKKNKKIVRWPQIQAFYFSR